MECVVLLSGGVDSTTCLAMAVEKYGSDQVLALTAYYGQKHAKELEAARKVLNMSRMQSSWLKLAARERLLRTCRFAMDCFCHMQRLLLSA